MYPEQKFQHTLQVSVHIINNDTYNIGPQRG